MIGLLNRDGVISRQAVDDQVAGGAKGAQDVVVDGHLDGARRADMAEENRVAAVGAADDQGGLGGVEGIGHDYTLARLTTSSVCVAVTTDPPPRGQ